MVNLSSTVKEYDLRITIGLPSKAEFTKYIELYKHSFYLFGYEISKAGAPHVHCVFDSTYCDQTLRTKLKQHFPDLKGNGSYKLGEVRDKAKALAYALKDGDYVSFGIDDDLMDEVLSIDASIKENKKRVSKNLWKDIYEAYKQHCKSTRSPTELGAFIIAWHLDHDKMIRKFSIQSIYDTIEFARMYEASKGTGPRNGSFAQCAKMYITPLNN